MKILIVNYAMAGFTGDHGQMSLIAKGLEDLGHKVTIAIIDRD